MINAALLLLAILGVAVAIITVARAEHIAQRFADRILTRELGVRSTLPIAETWGRDPVGTTRRRRKRAQ